MFPILDVTPSTDIVQLINTFVQSETYYVGVIVFFGWIGFDHYFRKKYVLHIVQEEGNLLTEVKRFSKPLSWANRMLEWKVRGRGETQPIIRKYKLDPNNVIFIDRFNKRHIISSISNVFSFHPVSEAEKLKLITIAQASADDLGAVIGKAGFLTRIEAVANALGVNRNTALGFVLIGVVIGLTVGYNMMPQLLGQHLVQNTIPHINATSTMTGTR